MQEVTVRWEQLKIRINLNIEKLSEEISIPIEEPTAEIEKEPNTEKLSEEMSFHIEEPVVEMESEPMMESEPGLIDEPISPEVKLPIQMEFLQRTSKTIRTTTKKKPYHVKLSSNNNEIDEHVIEPTAESTVSTEIMLEPNTESTVPEEMLIQPAGDDTKPEEIFTKNPFKFKVSSKRTASQTPEMLKKKAKKKRISFSTSLNCASKKSRTISFDDDLEGEVDNRPVQGWPDMTLNVKLQEVRVAYHWIHYRMVKN